MKVFKDIEFFSIILSDYIKEQREENNNYRVHNIKLLDKIIIMILEI